MVLTFWELGHEEILTIVRAYGHRVLLNHDITTIILKTERRSSWLWLSQMFVQPKTDHFTNDIYFPKFDLILEP